jgi:hypothetical protein
VPRGVLGFAAPLNPHLHPKRKPRQLNDYYWRYADWDPSLWGDCPDLRVRGAGAGARGCGAPRGLGCGAAGCTKHEGQDFTHTRTHTPHTHTHTHACTHARTHTHTHTHAHAHNKRPDTTPAPPNPLAARQAYVRYVTACGAAGSEVTADACASYGAACDYAASQGQCVPTVVATLVPAFGLDPATDPTVAAQLACRAAKSRKACGAVGGRVAVSAALVDAARAGALAVTGNPGGRNDTADASGAAANATEPAAHTTLLS